VEVHGSEMGVADTIVLISFSGSFLFLTNWDDGSRWHCKFEIM